MRLSARSLVIVAALSFAASSAYASSTTITFGPPPGPGNDPAFTTYTQAGTDFTATQSTGQFLYNLNQLTQGSDTPPSLTGGVGNSYGDATDAIKVTDPGGPTFVLNSFDLEPNAGSGNSSVVYTITGFDGVNQVFQFTGTDSTNGSYTTYSTPSADLDVVTSVTLSFANTAGVYSLDNVVVTATPEPSSLLLLGTGLIGLGAFARRRFAL